MSDAPRTDRDAAGEGDAVYVETAARLHFGVLDLRGSLGRSFGGIGAAAPAPTALVSAAAAPAVTSAGDDAARAGTFARRFLAHHDLSGGARIRVHQAIPSHVGLGSGTQLGLAVGRALAELYGVPTDAPSLARAVGRTRRSAIGTWTFAGGGLVVEGGRRPRGDAGAPLLARLPFPASWRCVLAVPAAGSGISGADEAAAFAQLPPPAERDVEHVAHLVLMALLPAVAEADIATFGAALTEIQEITGRWFAPVQGGPFARGASTELVRRMRAWGALGVGQSSWGPTVYAVVEGDDVAAALAARVRVWSGPAPVVVHVGPFRSDGARVWRAAAGTPPD